MPPLPSYHHIKFGNNLDVTPEPSGVIRVDAVGGITGPPGPAGGYSKIQDEGTLLTQRDILNFTGAMVTAFDDPANNRTNVNVSPLQAIYAHGYISETVPYVDEFTQGRRLTITTRQTNGITPTSMTPGTRWTIQQAGLYLVLGNFELQMTDPGGIPINNIIGVTISSSAASGNASFGSPLASPEQAIPAGSVQWREATFAGGLGNLVVGDWIEWNSYTQTPRQLTVAGSLSILKVG